MENIFEHIYRENTWGNYESRSGDGSSSSATEAVRAALPMIVEEFSIRSILDVPCGDFNWMSLVELPVDYIGGDVVSTIIGANQRASARQGRSFQVMDITRDELPYADLVICRDGLVHLSLEDVFKALRNIVRSGARYCLATTFPSRDQNADIKTGQWRPLNLMRPPFEFPPPLRLIDERCEEWGGYWADKCLGLWKTEDIKRRLDGGGVVNPTSASRARVSVVIPTYNRSQFLGRSIASVLGQSFQDLELVVVDDGSTDDTPLLLSSFNDARLVSIRQENRGRSNARNVALQRARGDYITFLDSDDYYLPSKIEKEVAFLDRNPQFGMAYTAAACIGDDGQMLNFVYHAPLSGPIHAAIAFFRPLTITLPTVMVRRALLSEVGGFDETLERFEDTDMWRRLSKATSIGAIEDITCHIRTHSGNRLAMLDPNELETQVDQYVAKVLKEDEDKGLLFLGAGARRLYEHYGVAMAAQPQLAEVGSRMLSKGRRHFNPRVSIIIPVYNGADYLRLAIDSALAQTYTNVEIIVVNDGSTDGGATERVARSYGDRVKYSFKSNGGTASALNAALREATGDFVSWLSHDDLYTRDKLERQIGCLAQQADPDFTVVYGDYSVFETDPAVGFVMSMPGVEPERFRYFITTQNILHGCTLLIPAAAFRRHGYFDEALKTTQDYDLWFRMAESTRFVHSSGVVVLARSHAAQGTRTLADAMIPEINTLLSRFVETLSPVEVELGCPRGLLEGYLDIAKSFRTRSFLKAEAHALSVAGSVVQSRPQDAIAIILNRRDLEEPLAKLKAELERDREAAAKDRELLSALLASSSWRVTRPIRVLKRGIRRTVEYSRNALRLRQNRPWAAQLSQTLSNLVGRTDRDHHAFYAERLNHIDSRLAALAAQVDALAINVTSQTGPIAAAVDMMQSRVADLRTSATAELTALEAARDAL